MIKIPLEPYMVYMYIYKFINANCQELSESINGNDIIQKVLNGLHTFLIHMFMLSYFSNCHVLYSFKLMLM